MSPGSPQQGTAKLSVVWVTAHVPDPSLGSDSEREFDLLVHAAREHDVRLIAISLPPGEITLSVGPCEIRAEGSSAALAPPKSPNGRVGEALQLVLHGRSHPRLARGRHRAVREVIARRLEREPVDLVHITGGQLAPLATSSSAPVALLLPASISRYWAQTKGETRGLTDELTRMRLESWERRSYSRANAIGCLNEEDRDWVERLDGRGGKPAHVGSPEALFEWWRRTSEVPGRALAQTAASVGPHRPGITETATVVVCTRDRPEALSRTLPAFAETGGLAAADLIIVEQGTPSAQAVCDELGISASIIHDNGAGAARARNIGVQSARGSVVLFSDDDCEVPPTWVQDHCQSLRNDGVVASFGRVEGLSRMTDFADPVARHAVHSAGSPPWVIGHSSNMAVSREAFLDAGGFDERLGPGTPGSFVCEDHDLIVRLLHAGGSVASGVGTAVLHLPWRDTKENLRNMRSYERGAGAWIGKLARSDRAAALGYLRGRLWLLANNARMRQVHRLPASGLLLLAASLARGLVHGWRLGYTKTSTDEVTKRVTRTRR
jgi:GT2 family glycosyltransferase